ncbi:MAG: glycosyl transferase [Proteobacteria bacterium]|nr:glycosyl transferase [Pseudomonadota bacterium]
MHSDKQTEHFVTLFDCKFLPMGWCLHYSLMTHAQPFHLWILCMDEKVEKQLEQLALSHVTLISLSKVETAKLLSVKEGRTKAEYCWTLTPFTPQMVFERDETVERVTYVDADLFFFDTPRKLFKEFDASGKSVLITEHAYAPEYEQSLLHGRFCVQFVVFNRTQEAFRVMKWWQEKCLEWCFARVEGNKFGDQKYLDIWPDLFKDDVHVLGQVDKTLAPWNVQFFLKNQQDLNPVFYHFHGLRIVSDHEVLLYLGYRIGKQGQCFYKDYVRAMSRIFGVMKALGWSIPVIPRQERWLRLRRLKRIFMGVAQYWTYLEP